MNGKVCLVTGANAGIGYETALGLAKMGARVAIVCRNEERGKEALSTLIAKSNNKNIALFIADLASQKSIRECAKEINEKYEKLDVLLNNAGIITPERIVTEDGFETQFAVNHLAPFLLTNLLMDLLKKSAAARIVTVASNAHKGAKANLEDLQSENGYNSKKVYGQTKLYNILFTNELARRLNGTTITANSLHPGVITTQLLQAYMGNNGVFNFISGLLFKTPEKGAETSIYLASSEDVQGVTGNYFDDKKRVNPSKLATDERTAKQLWEISENLTKQN